MAEKHPVSVEEYRLFNRVIELRLFQAPGNSLFFFTMHDNETTSVRAGRAVVKNRGGTLLELSHDGSRHISFRAGGESFRFDPNRMFSDHGVHQSLADVSQVDRVPGEVTDAVRQFAEFIVDHYQLDARNQLYTLHNVTDDLSVKSYMEGGEFQQNASRVERGSRGTTADFFLVTDQFVGNDLAERGWNVVVQDDRHVDEDGSLSVRARDMQVPYVNVEARQGHIHVQKKMIADLYRVTGERAR